MGTWGTKSAEPQTHHVQCLQILTSETCKHLTENVGICIETSSVAVAIRRRVELTRLS